MVDVFISYSRRDQEMVGVLARAIEAEGYDVWWDVELPPHESYGDVITAKIGATRAAVVVWSPDAVASEWVRAEADMARNQRKLIQTSLGDTMPPLPFNQIQYANLDGWRGEADHPGWGKVKRSLEALCGGRDAGRATTEAPRQAPPPAAPPPSPPARSRNWPLFAGIGIAAVALAAAGGVLLGQRASSVESQPASSEERAAPVAATPQTPEARPSSTTSAEPVAEADGEPPLAPAAADMTFPDSSTRLLTPAELAQLGPATLKVARNEIYARKGRRFRDPWLRDYFSGFAWYDPRHDAVSLNPVETRNVALIQQAEARYR
jgi:hypothetical protein